MPTVKASRSSPTSPRSGSERIATSLVNTGLLSPFRTGYFASAYCGEK
jgi:hypothetical protein